MINKNVTYNVVPFMVSITLDIFVFCCHSNFDSDLYLPILFTEKNLSFKISSFNECAAINLVKAGPIEFTKYPFEWHISETEPTFTAYSHISNSLLLLSQPNQVRMKVLWCYGVIH